MSQAPSHVYARRLLPKQYGYPLWIPEPSIRLPAAYQMQGVCLGDVGLVTSNGAFSFLFNICLPANHPINLGRTPDQFECVDFDIDRDVDEYPNLHFAGSYIACSSIKELTVNADVSSGDNPNLLGIGAGYKFTNTHSEGAVLVLPDGADSRDMNDLERFRDYALRHGLTWYRHVNVTLGRMAQNGSLYLVTGCDKSVSWGVASCSSASEEGRIALRFTSANNVAGNTSLGYTWETFSPASVRVHPDRIATATPNQRNQCVFLRGFRVSIRDRLAAKLGQPVKLTPVQNLKPGDVLGPEKGRYIPFSGDRRSVSGTSQGEPVPTPRSVTMAKLDNPNVGAEVQMSEADIHVELLPESSDPFHPSVVINNWILDVVPEAEVAVTHDSDWFDLVDSEHDNDDAALIDRISLRFIPTSQSGGAYIKHSEELQESFATIPEPNGTLRVIPNFEAIAQTVSEFALVPSMIPAVELLQVIIALSKNIVSNRYSASMLCDRFYDLLLSFRNASANMSSGKIDNAMHEIQRTLIAMEKKMYIWNAKGSLQSFLDHTSIAADIEKCHKSIDGCLSKFQIVSHFAPCQWRRDLRINAIEDHYAIIRYLSESSNTKLILNGALADQSGLAHRIMKFMQNSLGEAQLNGPTHSGLVHNLFELQMKTNMLLPELNLKRGEVRRLGLFPVSFNGSVDTWEGLYLNEKKVTIKEIRTFQSDTKILKRFEREVTIWYNIWKQDNGQHVLPFYGFCQTDGPNPYLVSPWQRHGTAITYVKANPNSVNYRKLIRGIAEGIKVLHTQLPPVIHGDIRGSNIVISDDGRPLIADFSVAKIVEDIHGAPFTQSHGLSNSYRWLAPELCIGPTTMSTSSDIYALSMTIIELLTHKQPCAHIENDVQAVIKSSQGERPMRPNNAVVVARGMDDNLWTLLTKCWKADPNERPNVHEVLNELS